MSATKKRTRKCIECGAHTEWKEITMKYESSGIKVKISGIKAMVCVNCSTEYIPGPQALVLSRAIDEIVSASLSTQEIAVGG